MKDVSQKEKQVLFSFVLTFLEWLLEFSQMGISFMTKRPNKVSAPLDTYSTVGE